MNRNFKLALAAAAALAWARAGAATYKNPILEMDFSDPDVCAGHDGMFYMTASSFGGLPGLPVLASEDLVNWQYAGCALERHPFDANDPGHGNAVWAPSIRYRADKGEYVVYWGDPDRGAYRVSAKKPAGPWSEPRLVVPGKGLIDPCPLYDDDGRIYLVNGWAQSRAGMNSVLTVRELDADETRAISRPVIVYDGLQDGNFTAEGPKFYKRGGEYWLFFPAGGVAGGWQVAARATAPTGPFTARTVMAQGSSRINGPHQGAWVCCEPDNRTINPSKKPSDWFVHFSDRGAYGRVVHLEPMEWREDGWPVIGVDADGDGCGEPVEEYEMPRLGSLGEQKILPQASDGFDATEPGLQWQWLGKSEPFPGFGTPFGFYRLYTTRCARFWETPNLMVQKFPAFAFSATMKCRVGAKEPTEEAGLVVQGRDYARLGLRYAGNGTYEVVWTECKDADRGCDGTPRVLAAVPAQAVEAGLRSANMKDVWLKVVVTPEDVPTDGPGRRAMCAFSWSLDGERWNACETKFQAREGKWIGATVGIYAISGTDCTDKGWVDIDWFRVERDFRPSSCAASASGPAEGGGRR